MKCAADNPQGFEDFFVFIDSERRSQFEHKVDS